jgi:hypothetical protein
MSDISVNLDGIFALFFGLPAMGIACVIVGILFVFPAHRYLKIIASILAIPAFLLGLALITDALSLSGPGWDDTLGRMGIVAYLALLGLLPCLLFVELRRKSPEKPINT